MTKRSTLSFWSKIINEQSESDVCDTGYINTDTDGDGVPDTCEPEPDGGRDNESVSPSGFRDMDMDQLSDSVDQAGAEIFETIKSFARSVSETMNYENFSLLHSLLESASESSESTDSDLSGKIKSLINFKDFWNGKIKPNSGIPSTAANLADGVIEFVDELQNSEYGIINSLDKPSPDGGLVSLSEKKSMKLTRKILRKEIISLMEAMDGPPGMNPPDQATFRSQRADSIISGRQPATAEEIAAMGSGNPGDLGPLTYDNWTDRTGNRFISNGSEREILDLTLSELSDVLEGNRVIRRGQRGKDVEIVQTLLVNFFLYQPLEDERVASELMGTSGSSGVGIDGVFGDGTEAAVRLAQQIARDSGMNYVQVDGQVGRQTLTLLMSGPREVTFDDPTPMRRSQEDPDTDTGPALVDALRDDDITVGAARSMEQRYTDNRGAIWIRRTHSNGSVTYHEEVGGNEEDIPMPDKTRTERGTGLILTSPSISWN